MRIFHTIRKTQAAYEAGGVYRIIKYVLLVTILAVVLTLYAFNLLERLELVALDYAFQLRGEIPQNPNIAIIEMGEDSVESIGRWPWPRSWHATMTAILKKYGARQIIFDVLFAEPSKENEDSAFAESIKQAGNVFLPFIFEFEESEGRPKVGDIRKPDKMTVSLPVFTRHAEDTGHINVFPDPDGVIRRAPLYIEYEGKRYPQLSYQALKDYLKVDEDKIDVKRGKYIRFRDTRIGDIELPIDRNYNFLINWAGRWKDTFEHFSYIDIIVSYQRELQGGEPRVDLTRLKDKICLIAATATGLFDVRPVPFDPTYPGVGLHANLINSVLGKNFIHVPGPVVNIFLILLAGFLTDILVLRFRPLAGAVVTLILVLFYFAGAFLAFKFFGVWVNIVYSASVILLSFIMMTLYREITIAVEKTKLFNLATRDGLTGLVNIRHFNLLLEAELENAKKLNRPLSVIMSDIDHFKHFNDEYGHQVGDFVLREVGKIFGGGARDLDVPARYGGEEMIMMLPGTDEKGAQVAAERIRKNIDEHVFKDGKKTYHVTISLGVSTFKGEKTKDELVKRADDALYMAKEGGRNKVCVSK